MIAEMTDKQYNRLRAVICAKCAYGKLFTCNGTPLSPNGEKRIPCRYYKNKCIQPDIVICRERIKKEIEENNEKIT